MRLWFSYHYFIIIFVPVPVPLCSFCRYLHMHIESVLCHFIFIFSRRFIFSSRDTRRARRQQVSQLSSSVRRNRIASRRKLLLFALNFFFQLSLGALNFCFEQERIVQRKSPGVTLDLLFCVDFDHQSFEWRVSLLMYRLHSTVTV